MTDCDALLAGIVADPLEETRWLVLADWLEEHDDPQRAELLRLHRRMLATCCEPDAHPDRAAWQSRMVELLIAGVRPCVPQETLILPGGVPMTFSFIPPGSFLMGSERGEDNEKPVHRVEVSHSFFMGVHLVTETQWVAATGYELGELKGPERPMGSVSLSHSEVFCEKLLELIERKVELPTEVEWEFACRAGTTTEYHFGDVINTDLVNYNGNFTWNGSPEGEYRKQPTNVGSFPPNAWGLFDVHGNLLEWCGDEYSPYPKSIKDNNKIESLDRQFVLRGGCWGNNPYCCRAAHRSQGTLGSGGTILGFRVCLRLD